MNAIVLKESLSLFPNFRKIHEAGSYVDFYQIATIYAGLGEKDEAVHWLEKAYEEHSSSMPFLAVDPFRYGMRSDPRYTDLLRRMGRRSDDPDIPEPSQS